MNITPVNFKTYSSKNQNSPNFKATIVTEFGLNLPVADSDTYAKWLRKLIIANLPIANPEKYTLIEDGDKLLAPIDDAIAEPAERFVRTIKRALHKRGISSNDLRIDLDPRPTEELVWVD